MAKTKSPLLSSSAHGKLGRSLVYSKKKTGLITRAMHFPKKEPTLKQWTRRHIVGLLTAHWQCMTDNEHASWNALAVASGLNIPGYQYFLKSAQADLYTHHGLITYLSFNESTGGDLYCYSFNEIVGGLEPSYPDNCPIRIPSFRKEYGNALSFDGIDDYGIFNYQARLNFTTQATIEFWIKLGALDFGGQTVVTRWLTGGDRRVFYVRIVDNLVRFFFSEFGTDDNFLNANTLLTLEWTHLAFRLSADHKINIFINAVQDSAEGELNSFHTNIIDFLLGGVWTSQNFYGCLDEVRLYNRALSYTEIKKHYQLLRLDKKRQPLLRL